MKRKPKPKRKQTMKRKQKRRKTPQAKPLIRCVIFDLDDTLYDCLGQRVPVAHRHAAQAMVEAGLNADVEAVYRARMQAFRQDPMLRYIDPEVSRRFGAEDPDAISRAAREAYFNCPVGQLRLFPGSLPLLRFLAGRGVRNFIVSFGEPEIQHAKVKALGLDREPSIEKIYYADRSNVLTKQAAFCKIQHRTGFAAAEILVVGDRPAREIRAGRELGMHTVRLRHGEFKTQMPVGKEEEPDFVLDEISRVRHLPFKWGEKSKPHHGGTETRRSGS
jgi:FMN phosphatase YigB (HAD superfamily)